MGKENGERNDNIATMHARWVEPASQTAPAHIEWYQALLTASHGPDLNDLCIYDLFHIAELRMPEP